MLVPRIAVFYSLPTLMFTLDSRDSRFDPLVEHACPWPNQPCVLTCFSVSLSNDDRSKVRSGVAFGSHLDQPPVIAVRNVPRNQYRVHFVRLRTRSPKFIELSWEFSPPKSTRDTACTETSHTQARFCQTVNPWFPLARIVYLWLLYVADFELNRTSSICASPGLPDFYG